MSTNGVEGPYVGLTSYEEKDARFFFGRDIDTEIIRTNLVARRLTLLYGASGVGKSSVLRAGVLPELKGRAGDDGEGGARFLPIVFSEWAQDPIDGLLEAVAVAAHAAYGEVQESAAMRLDDALAEWANAAGAELLIVLDQFEEYFLYNDEGSDRFADEFPSAVERFDVRAHFLISIREDALAQLDRFKRRLPRLFESTLRIRHLSRADAQRAIEGPLEEYNRDASEPVTIEPALIQKVLDQVESGQVTLDERGQGGNASAGIETPYLQLVMTRLWEEEVAHGSQALRLHTFEELGGAKRIVRDHLDEAVDALPPRDRDIAASAFRFLVTSTGSKIAQSPDDLAEFTGEPASRVKDVLQQLASGRRRILRPVTAPDGAPRYEIFHDVLAGAVLDWRRRLAEQRARRERQKARLSLVAASVFLLLAAFAILISVFALHQKHQADAARRLALSDSLLRAAQDATGTDIGRSFLLNLEAYQAHPSAATRAGLVRAVQRSDHLEHLFPGRGERRDILFSPDGSKIATREGGRVVIWNVASGRRAATIRTNAQAAAFSPDGTTLATAGPNGVLLWDLNHPTPPRKLPRSVGAAALGFTSRGSRLTAVLGSEATIAIVGPQMATWDVHSARLLRTEQVRPDYLLAQVAVSLRGDFAFVGSNGVTILRVRPDGRVRSTEGLSAVTLGSPDTALSFSDDGRFLGVVAPTGVVSLCNVLGARCVHSSVPRGSRRAASIALGRNQWEVAVGWSDGTTDVWSDIRDSDSRKTLRGHSADVSEVAFGPDGQDLATSGDDGVIALWSPWQTKLSRPLSVPDGLPVDNVSIGARTAAAATTDHLYAWTSLHGPPQTFKAGSDSTPLVAVARNGESLAAAANDRVLSFVLRGSRKAKAIGEGHGQIYQLALGDGIVAWATDSGFTIWDPRRNRKRSQHVVDAFITGLALSADSQTVAVATDNGTILFSTRHGSRLGTLSSEADNAVAFGKNDTVATAGNRQIVLWDARRRRRIGAPLTTAPARPTSVAFSPDGRTLAAALEGINTETVAFWDVATGTELGKPLEGFGAAKGLGFSGDGRYLETATDFAVALLNSVLWDDIPAMQSRLCAIVGRNLTQSEWHEFIGSGDIRRTCAQWPGGA